MRVAITGATGSLGGALLEVLRSRGDVSRVVSVSRDEVKSGDLADRHRDWASLKCMLADVRDEVRLVEVFRGCDVVIHAAALKRITHSVYSPEEIVKTNVAGTINVIRAATEAGVGRVVVVSSDKAVESTNLYGMTKAVAECYAVQANSYSVPRGTSVACVRYGNVLGSRGSVVHVWRDALRRGEPLDVTDARMTRFVITLRQAASFVLDAASSMQGGEIFVPLLPAARIMDLLGAVARQAGWGGEHVSEISRHVGLRPGGEKLHEALISREEPARSWVDSENVCRVVVLPSHHSWRETFDPPAPRYGLAKAYTSEDPVHWLGAGELASMLEDVP